MLNFLIDYLLLVKINIKKSICKFMATVNEKLQAIQNSKNAIKNAIIAKGGTAGDVLSEYAAAIAALPTSGGSPSDPFVTKEFKSFVEAEELEYINVRGALLWTKDGVSEGTNGYLLANNGWDASHVEEGYTYWDPNSTTITTPTKTGYTLIGVCLGNGYWVRIGYAGLTTTKYWCQSSDGAYGMCECYKSGYDMTKARKLANDYSADSIWGLRDLDPYAKDKDNNIVLYIPSQGELTQVCLLACDGGAHTSGHRFSKNLGALCSFGQDYYWSGSQYPNSYGSNRAFFVAFGNGYASYYDKDEYEFRSVALFHFGA